MPFRVVGAAKAASLDSPANRSFTAETECRRIRAAARKGSELACGYDVGQSYGYRHKGEKQRYDAEKSLFRYVYQ